MKKDLTLTVLATVALFTLLACEGEDDTNDFLQPASLTVAHGAIGAPAVHVDYFGDELETLDFSINPTLALGSTDRFTIPADETRSLAFTYASDTTSVVFEENLTLRAGEIKTYFLLGDSLNLRSETIETVGLRRLNDSINAIRFINMTKDVPSVEIGIQDSTGILASGLSFAQPSGFVEVDATLENESYTFTFSDGDGNELSTFNFQQYRIFNFPSGLFIRTSALRRNVTLALVGELDNGEGNNTLQVIRINHY